MIILLASDVFVQKIISFITMMPMIFASKLTSLKNVNPKREHNKAFGKRTRSARIVITSYSKQLLMDDDGRLEGRF
jgi:hypothetical protein